MHLPFQTLSATKKYIVLIMMAISIISLLVQKYVLSSLISFNNIMNETEEEETISSFLAKDKETAATKYAPRPAAVGITGIDGNVIPEQVGVISSNNLDNDSIATKIEILENLQTRVYLYDHPNITLEEELDPMRKLWWRYATEIFYEESLLSLLKKSPLRTMDPDEADVFVPPIPMTRTLCAVHKKKKWRAAFAALINHPIFRKYGGQHHLLIALSFPLFREGGASVPLRSLYKHLVNMTLVQSWDQNGVSKALANGYDFHEYHHHFKTYYSTPITHSSMSLGLGSEPDPSVVPFPEYLNIPRWDFYPKKLTFAIPLKLATMEKFHDSSNFIFYQTRTLPSFANSTIYRQAPVTNVTMENLPKSRIGFGIDTKEEWIKEYIDSKFCLVIRGDSPHSNALQRAVRVGCIPVVVADCLPIYSPVMKSILNMSDYTIMMDEKKFTQNPEQSMLSLLELSEEELEVKMKHLAFAQRVTMMDHPESLFIPAFLHGAVSAYS